MTGNQQMQVSIGKLAALSISLLIAVTIVTTGAGISVLMNHYRALESGHGDETREIVRNAAVALRDSVRFYQGVPSLVPTFPVPADSPDSPRADGTTQQARTAQETLEGLMREGDRFLIVDEHGRERLSVGNAVTAQESGTFHAQIPDTRWKLVLHRPVPRYESKLVGLVVFDTLALFVVVVVAVSMVRIVLGRFRSDLSRLRSALEEVSAGRYRAATVTASIDEIEILFPQIEQLAQRIEQQHEKLQHQSLSDPLTGLFNRRYFDLMLAHLHEQSERHLPATLAIVDLNGFQQINEEFGRPRGDRVLQQMAGYLLSRVRTTDIVVRLGGDQFGLLLTNMAGETLDDWLAALVHDHDHQTLEEDRNGRFFCQFSVGVAQIDGHAYATPTEVFNAADMAMYAVKQRRGIHHSRYAVARPGNVTAIRSRKEAL